MGDNDPLDFAEALTALKAGECLTRSGWNGAGMFIYLVAANSYEATTDQAKGYFGSKVPYQSYVAMKTAQNDVVPWVASQTDILADDWHVRRPN